MPPLDPIPVETAPAVPTQEERTAALMLWLVNIPLHIIGPLIVWWVMGNGSAYVWHHARACVNHTLTILVLILLALIPAGASCAYLLMLDDLSTLSPGMLITFIVVVCVSLLAIPVLGLVSLIIHILAAFKSHAGTAWTPPLCWRFMR